MNELLNRLINYFPGVIWTDFTDSKGTENFWELLEYINTQTENSKTFLLKLFEYNKSNSENSKKETFKYMLPGEEFVKKIPQEFFDKQNNTFQAILDYEEMLFLKELINILNIKESDLSNEDDGYFPVAKYYPKWNEWSCLYDKKHYRFNWDSEIDYDILMYNPNNPFDAFIRKCQYAYTLLRISFENKLNGKTKEEIKNKGLSEIYNHFKLSSLYSKEDNDEKINALIGNIQMGLESKADKESEFYLKSFEQTIKKIDFCRFEKKFEKKKYLDKYQLSYEEYKKIREIYDEKEKLEWSGFYALEKENVFLRLSILNYNIERLPENERKIIYTINKRLKETRTISFDAPSSKDSEDTDNLYDIVEDKNDYNKNSFYEIENRKESLVTALQQEFCSPIENPFYNILDAYAESYDKFAILDASLYEILYAKSKDISNNELFLKYLGIANKEVYATNKQLQSLFKKKITCAIEKLKEGING
ncbi:MAG: hypothetical protein IJ361_05260 [Spirochaetaceae bacterium]|nr:hypothetical protein [Spirochaetaceae bacterium]